MHRSHRIPSLLLAAWLLTLAACDTAGDQPLPDGPAPADAAPDGPPPPADDAGPADGAMPDAPATPPLVVELVTVGGIEWLDRLFVPVSHAGVASLMLLDTGAATSFLYLGAGGPDWRPEAGEVRILDRPFTLGGRGFPATVHEGKPVVGTLGADLLLGHTTPAAAAAALDLRCGRLSLWLDGPAPAAEPSWVEIPFDSVQGHAIVPARVDGADLRLMLDTGAQHLLWLGEQGRPDDTPVQTTDAEGSLLTLYLGESQLELGGEPARPVLVLRAPSFPYLEQTVKILGGEIHGLLGLSAFGRRSLAFTRDLRALRLEPAGVDRECPAPRY